jgi:hypothetical protein
VVRLVKLDGAKNLADTLIKYVTAVILHACLGLWWWFGSCGAGWRLLCLGKLGKGEREK